MDGLWETAVESFKFNFKGRAVALKLTFKELSTVLPRIEKFLYSRPLSVIAADPTDLTALTPRHLLTGKPIMLFRESASEELYLVNKWEKLKALHYQFSIKWKKDYLSTS